MRRVLEFFGWVLLFNLAVPMSPFGMMPYFFEIPPRAWMGGVFAVSLIFGYVLCRESASEKP